MTKPYTGGCACGAIRYEARGAPVFENHCQCRDCQRRSGTGHGSYLTFAAREVTIAGAAGRWRVRADNGKEKLHAFCPACGTPVYLDFAANPDFLAVHAASLDEPERFRPQAVTFGLRGLDWDRMDAGLTVFETMPG